MPVVLITGANRGIGLAHARRYLERGWRVIAACRDPGSARDLAALDPGHGRLDVHAYDAAQGDSARRLAAATSGPVDVLFANAGIIEAGPQHFGAAAHEGWMDVMRVNALAPLALAEAFADRVAASQRKTIALQSSRVGSVADNTSGGMYAYRASKAALNMIGKSLSVDLKPRGISVIILHPGWVKTAMGGAGAPLTPEESAAGEQAQIDAITPAESGRFVHQSGEALPW